MTERDPERNPQTPVPPATRVPGEPAGQSGEGDEPESTVGTGSALALGCVGVMLMLILLGILFFLVLWLIA